MRRAAIIGAALVAALAAPSGASAATWQQCGTIHASVDGVATSTAVWGISPGGKLPCSAARRVARTAIRLAFPGGRMQVGGELWRGGDWHSSESSSTITYKRGRNAVQLDSSVR